MKITGILLMAACLQLSAKGITQTVSISVKDAPLITVLKEIRKQTGYAFFADNKQLEKAKKISISVKNVPLLEVLDACFKDQPLSYTITDNVINVFPKEEKISTQNLSFFGTANINIKGRVINEDNEPVENVSITIKGTAIGTTTNANGEFFLKDVDDNATLVFTSVNMETYEMKVKGRDFLAVTLQTKITAMQEVVINKGYYMEKKKFATGNVVSITSKDIQNQPVNNPLLALVGRVPGVIIQPQSGYANSGIVVRIQGVNSITSGKDPLYVIDGIPYLSTSLKSSINAPVTILGGNGTNGGGIGGNPLSVINPNDIESIDVLKDADATSLYGSRGANGVILITTKKGKAGQTTVDASFRGGWGKVAKRMDLLNTEQYLEMRRESYINEGKPVPDQTTAPASSNYDLTVWDPKRYTDWQDVLFGGTAKYTDASVGISGGSGNTQFRLNTFYHKETTVFPGNLGDQKGSFQFNINHASNNQKFKLQASGIYSVDKNKIPQFDLVSTALKLAPNAPALYNPDGTLNWQLITVGGNPVSTWTNPLAFLDQNYSNKQNVLIGNFQMSYRLFKNLMLSSRLGYTNTQYNELALGPISAVRPERRPTSNRGATFGNANNDNWSIEPQANYSINIGKNKIEALLGTSFQSSITKNYTYTATGQSSDQLLQNPQAATSITASTPIYIDYKYNAVFGRLNYNFNDRYILNATARRDGSSRFGSKNIFNNFWSIAGAWVFTNEKRFFKNPSFLSFGKLRVSYGISGNDQIADYGFMDLYNTLNAGVAYQNITGLIPKNLPNLYLQWEETNKFQLGLDLGLLNDRINLTANYYRNRSSNLLLQTRLSNVTGFGSIIQNFPGVIENEGWEFALSTNNIRKKDFSWTTNLNFTIPHHNGQLVAFPNLANSTYANSYVVGTSVLNQRFYHYIGVDPVTGIYLFEDSKGNATSSPVDPTDEITYINDFPTLFGGMQNTISYKAFQLDFSIQGVKRKAQQYYGEQPGAFPSDGIRGNQPAILLNRWQKPGDQAIVERVGNSYPDINVLLQYLNFNSSDAKWTDASYLRLTNLALSWNVPEQWRKATHFKSARVFIEGQNLLTVTKYKGLDPSVGAGPTTVALPPLRVVTIGANVSF